MVVDETNVSEIVHAIETLVRDPFLRKKMAHNGLRLIKDRFNWEAMGEKLTKIYASL
jgi:glycosyltransferase involved in cell wall biosynthesis